ncbi:MAG: transposase [Rhodobacteraceae bacterium]|nr:transposase [Paracoccaceae bacterium]
MISSVMSSGRWEPPIEPSASEARILKRVAKKRKLFGFLRAHRHELFSDEFQDELAAVYRKSGAGKPRIPPAKLAMVLLLQAYSDASDSEAVELAACDARWQVCLDCLGGEPPFSQGALFDFRHRLIEHGLDKRLLERTVELARESGIFDWKQVPKKLRVVVDSSPLRGGGRVEDTINLLAHAARKIVAVVANRMGLAHELVVDEMGIPLLAAPSIKSGLDIDWTVPGAGEAALNRLLVQIDAMERWVKRTLADESRFPPLRDHLELLDKLRGQDLEPDPTRPGACVFARAQPEIDESRSKMARCDTGVRARAMCSTATSVTWPPNRRRGSYSPPSCSPRT